MKPTTLTIDVNAPSEPVWIYSPVTSHSIQLRRAITHYGSATGFCDSSFFYAKEVASCSECGVFCFCNEPGLFPESFMAIKACALREITEAIERNGYTGPKSCENHVDVNVDGSVSVLFTAKVANDAYLEVYVNFVVNNDSSVCILSYDVRDARAVDEFYSQFVDLSVGH